MNSRQSPQTPASNKGSGGVWRRLPLRIAPPLFLLLASLAATTCSQPEQAKPVPPIILDADQAEAVDGPFAIKRSLYEATLKDGLQTVMRWYHMKPAYSNSKFMGYEVVEVYRKELKSGPIRTGDVIVAVNDIKVERPEHALKVWRGLWDKKTLKLKLLREGKPRVYDIPIVSD